MKKLIVGNWKMNGSVTSAKALIADLVNGMAESPLDSGKACTLAVCPPFLHISAVRHALHGYPKIALGAQDCSIHENGAYTGDISADMLKDMTCSYVILGHSERRRYHGESDSMIAQKVDRVLACDMIPIVCIGETEDERQAGRAEDVVAYQLAHSLPSLGPFHEIVIAYEPVWAIGTGKTATPEDAGAMHDFIRKTLKNHVSAPEKTPILYGGSMNPDNAAALLSTPNIDGGLIGGASLKAESFLALASAA